MSNNTETRPHVKVDIGFYEVSITGHAGSDIEEIQGRVEQLLDIAYAHHTELNDNMDDGDGRQYG